VSFAQTLPRTAQILLSFSRPNRPAGDVSASLAELFDESVRQGVAGLIARGPLEPRLVDLAKPWLLANSAQALAIAREAGAIARLLGAAGIECLFLKGPFLSARYYGDLGLRDAGDLDLLVPEDAVWAADAILQAAGYSRFKPRRALAGGRARMYLDTQHEIGYWSPDRHLPVELHWRFADCKALQHATFAELFERSHVLAIGPLTVRALSPVDSFVHLAIHGSLVAWPRLKWVADLAFVEAALTAEDAAALDRLSREPAYGRMITLARSLTAAQPAAARWLSDAWRHVAGRYRPSHDGPMHALRHHRYVLSLVRGVRNRLAFLRANAIMPGDFDASGMPDYASGLLPYVALGRRVFRKTLGAA
jgi:hypothetical protein